ncbi:MAG: tetratricopeptide repeat protein, partial [Verrucomicrobiota bacterium]|nr:tetratricopeptide repeat protein [Verrucomicrobiota bacterium]
LIALAIVIVYANSFSAPFTFDDVPTIPGNATIRNFWDALHPPHNGSPADGRPIINLSLALNYKLSGLRVWSYHLFNVLIHAGATLALFGIVRRTLGKLDVRDQRSDVRKQKPEAKNNPTSDIGHLTSAFCIALLWAVHPLQTESVTYIAQRAESLMSLFYLLTLYCFIRYAEESDVREQTSAVRSRKSESKTGLTSDIRYLASVFWPLASVFCCALGMASKEVMVSAPLMVLLYDRTFVGGSFAEAWRKRRGYYVALAGTWIILGCLIWSAGDRGGSAGFKQGVEWWAYALTQCRAIVHYLRLTVWPSPLVFDYGTNVVRSVAAVWPQALLLVALAAATIVAVARRSAFGFLGFWFFAILAPSSSIVPVKTESMAEHRMYLPLAAVIVLMVLGLRRALRENRTVVILSAALAVGLGWTTVRRNRDYRSEVEIWRDTVVKCPGNARAQYNLGTSLVYEGRLQEAIVSFEVAVQLNPNDALTHYNLGLALFQLGRVEEAIAHFRKAIQLDPTDPDAHNNLGNAWARVGRLEDAAREYQRALQLQPDDPGTHDNLGDAWFMLGRTSEAIDEYRAALKIRPDFAQAYYNLGSVLGRLGRLAEAAQQFEEALRLDPNYVAAHTDLGDVLLGLGQTQEAIAHYEAALRLAPDNAIILDRLNAARRAWAKTEGLKN